MSMNVKSLRSGQIWNGDSAEVLKQLPNVYIDLTVTSPPYDSLRTYGGNEEFNFEEIATQLYRVTKVGGVVVWVVGDQVIDGSESCNSFRQALYFKELGFLLHDTMIYQRASQFPCHSRYYQEFEYMFVFSKEAPPKTASILKDWKSSCAGQKVHSRQRGRDGNLKSSSGKKKGAVYNKFRARGNIWRYNAGYAHSTKWTRAHEHPAIFPEKLVEDHIKTWSKEGDLVLDPFSGSGTTAVVADRLGRNFLAIEKNSEYYNLSIERVEEQSHNLFNFLG